MTVGFTGTQSGMTSAQADAVLRILIENRVRELHHGDCVGADARVHELALQIGAHVVVHPPTDPKLQAFCHGPVGRVTILKPKGYLPRNRDIVTAGKDGLIAAPKTYTRPANLRGEGTWTTVGYGEQANRRIWLVKPDGAIELIPEW